MSRRRRRDEPIESIDVESGYTSPGPTLNSPYPPTNIASPTLEDEVEDRIYREFLISDDDLGGDSDPNDEKTVDILKKHGLLDSASMLPWHDDVDEHDEQLDAPDGEGAGAMRRRLHTEPITPVAAAVSPAVLQHTDSGTLPTKEQEDALLVDDKPWRRTPFRSSKAKDSRKVQDTHQFAASCLGSTSKSACPRNIAAENKQ